MHTTIRFSFVYIAALYSALCDLFSAIGNSKTSVSPCPGSENYRIVGMDRVLCDRVLRPYPLGLMFNASFKERLMLTTTMLIK